MSVSKAYQLVVEAANLINHDKAVALLLKALELDPSSSLARFHLGMIYSSRGLHTLAIQQFDALVAVSPTNDPGIWFLLARQHHLSSNNSKAIDCYLKALELDPVCEKACLYVAQLFCKSGEFEAAMPYAQKAIDMRPSTSMVANSEFESTLALCLQGCNKNENESLAKVQTLDVGQIARATVERLVAAFPNTKQTFDSFGLRCSDCHGLEELSVLEFAREHDCDENALVNALSIEIQSIQTKA